MASTVSNVSSPIATKLVVETDSQQSTPVNNVTGTSGNFYLIDIDNTANGAVTYFKMYDTAGPTIGTTEPDFVIKVAASSRRVFAATDGFAFSALSFICSTVGGRAQGSDPGSAVVVRILCT